MKSPVIKRMKYPILFLTLILLLFLLSGFYRLLLNPLAVGKPIDKDFGDVILVLGGGLKEGYQIGFSTEERLDLAAELYGQKKRLVIISDGSLYKGSPAIKKMVDYLAAKGVDRADVRCEGKSQTTFDNFVFAQEMLKGMNPKGIIVCTSPYHQRRARMILSYLHLTDFKIARMGRSEIYRAPTVKQRMRNIKLILREYFAIVKFKLLKR